MGMLKEHYFQPDAPDAVLAEDEVLRCVRRFVPRARALTGVDESGGEARTYTVDRDLILKVQRPHQVRVSTSLARESFFLRHLAEHAPDLPVPRVLGHARESNLLEYNVQTRMPGVAVAGATLSPEAMRAAVFDVGRLLRRLHALPQGPLHASAHFPTDRTAADFKARIADYFGVVAGRLGEDRRDWPLETPLEAVAERTLAALPGSEAFVALHSNPGPSHAFVDPDTGRFVGLIDFGDAYISHPALDVWRWRRPTDRAAAFAGYTAEGPVSDHYLRTWECVCATGDAVLIAYQPELAAEAAEDLNQRLKEL